MKLIQGTTEFELKEKSAVAIGKFDGIHIGHQKLLQQLLVWKKKGMQAVVFTFDPPPNVFFQKMPQQELTTREEKRKLFEEMGIDVLIEYPLNLNTAATTPVHFIEQILKGRIHAVKIAAGTDLSFGYQGAGNCALLKELSQKCGYEVTIVEKVCMDGREISSTLVRNEVTMGNMEMAARLLGMPYFVSGTVQHGAKLGRTIGMPTVNLLPLADKLLPPKGVYFSRIEWKDRELYGVTNIGCRPTVSLEQSISVETYLYQFQEEIYGETIRVFLLHYRREEMQFAGIEALKEQMKKDKEAGAQYFHIKEH